MVGSGLGWKGLLARCRRTPGEVVIASSIAGGGVPRAIVAGSGGFRTIPAGYSTVVVAPRWTNGPASLTLVRHGESVGNLADGRAREARAEVLDLDDRDADVELSP